MAGHLRKGLQVEALSVRADDFAGAHLRSHASSSKILSDTSAPFEARWTWNAKALTAHLIKYLHLYLGGNPPAGVRTIIFSSCPRSYSMYSVSDATCASTHLVPRTRQR